MVLVSSRQQQITVDHQTVATERAVALAFRAHTSPAFHRLAHTAAGIDPPGGSSLATCKRSRSSVESAGTGAVPLDSEIDATRTLLRMGVDAGRAVELAERGPGAWEVVYESVACDESRREKVFALLELGEVSHALRLATCRRKSIQLECPEMAGGCGSNDNYVPAHCDSRLCEDCAGRNIGRNIEKWKHAVHDMEYPAFLTFTIENVADAAEGRERIIDAFGLLRDRTVPFEGSTVREGELKGWEWSEWKRQLLNVGAHDIARRLQKAYVNYEYENVTGVHVGRNIPFSELVGGGLYAVDVKQKGRNEYNVHLHVILDVPYVPQAALSSVWEDITGDPVVDIRRIHDRSGDGIKSALLETVGYAVKPPEFETLEDEVEYITETKGTAAVHPFGSLHGNAADIDGLLRCAHCDIAPAWWGYCGLVDGHHDNVSKGWDVKGENDPPEVDELTLPVRG